MLYIFYGHRFWTRRKLDRLLSEARQKGRVVAHISSESEEPLSGFLSQGLFGEKRCVWSEGMFGNPARADELKDVLGALIRSFDIFIFLEEKLPEGEEEALKKEGAKVEEVKTPSAAKIVLWAGEEAKKLGTPLGERELKLVIEEAGGDPWAISATLLGASVGGEVGAKKASRDGPNYFDFTDAASAKNRGRAIKLMRGYIKEGFGAEGAFWKLWWKIKTLRMVEAGAKDAGIHQFVEKKALEDLSRWNQEELRLFSLALCDAFSEARRGEKDFEEGLLGLLVR